MARKFKVTTKNKKLPFYVYFQFFICEEFKKK